MKRTVLLLAILILSGCGNLSLGKESALYQIFNKKQKVEHKKLLSPDEISSYLPGTEALDSQIKIIIDKTENICHAVFLPFGATSLPNAKAVQDIQTLLKFAGTNEKTAQNVAYKKYSDIQECFDIFMDNQKLIESAVYNYYIQRREKLEADCLNYGQGDEVCKSLKNRNGEPSLFGIYVEKNDQTGNLEVNKQKEEFALEYLKQFYIKNADYAEKIRHISKVNKNVNSYLANVGKYYTQKEQILFKQKYGDKKICNIDIVQLLQGQTSPSKSCIYQVFEYAELFHIISSTKSGSLYDSDTSPAGIYEVYNPIFLYGAEEKADGSRLKAGYFTYEGLFRYTTTLGAQKSVMAFKKVNLSEFEFLRGLM